MGFFQGSQQIAVSSSVWNLAGDVTTRPNFLETTVLGATLSSSDLDMCEQLNTAYIGGPGIQIRNYGDWANQSGYNTTIGMNSSILNIAPPIDPTVLAPLLPVVTGETTLIQQDAIGYGDYTYWVDQYMLIHYPALISTAYSCDLDTTTNIVTITFADTTTTTFTLSGFNPGLRYLYVVYNYEIPPVLPSTTPTYSPLTMLIYQQGSGIPALDALFSATSSGDYFLPYIPFLVDKNIVGPSTFPAVYTASKEALRRSIGADYDALMVKILENPSIADVDYIYAVFGVALNVLENSCRMYIYQFFLAATAGQDLTLPAAMYTGGTVVVTSNGAWFMDYWQQVLWTGCTETKGTGLLTNGDTGNPAKVNDCWFTIEYDTVVSNQVKSAVRLTWQVDLNNWRYLIIYDLEHLNMIYGGKGVITYMGQAMADSNESSFLIPLNSAVYAAMSLKDSTQMCTACCYLVFNCYTVKRAPWYTAGFFKVLLIVVGIALSIVLGGAGGLGLLGSNIAVGTMFGFTGTMAVIAGALANALAAMVLLQVVQWGSTKLFGPQLGAIIGAVVGLFAMQIGTALANGMSMSALFNLLTQPANLIKLTEAAGNVYSQIMQIQAQDINTSTQTMENSYNVADAKIQALSEQQFGTGGGADLAINPLALTDTALPNVGPNIVLAESPSSFFSRTLLSGSDIADLSMSYVNNFCDANISTTLPTNQA